MATSTNASSASTTSMIRANSSIFHSSSLDQLIHSHPRKFPGLPRPQHPLSHPTPSPYRSLQSINGLHRYIVAHTISHQLHTFVIPPTESHDSFKPIQNRTTITPISFLKSPTPILSYTVCDSHKFRSIYQTSDQNKHYAPDFNHDQCFMLYSSRDFPIRLVNVSNLSGLSLASYHLQFPTTEEFIAASALVWARNHDSFVAGVAREGGGIATFDIEYPAVHGPIRWTPISHNRHRRRRRRLQSSLVSLTPPWEYFQRGIVSCLSLSCHGLLAAGTFGRTIAFFEHEGRGTCVSSFVLHPSSSSNLSPTPSIPSRISEVKWSPCGIYLFVSEFQSDNIRLFDIRNTGRQVCQMIGRRALSSLKQNFSLAPTKNVSHVNVWAGGLDGRVRSWSNVTSSCDIVEPQYEWSAHSEPVTTVECSYDQREFITCASPLREMPKLSHDYNSNTPGIQQQRKSREAWLKIFRDVEKAMQLEFPAVGIPDMVVHPAPADKV